MSTGAATTNPIADIWGMEASNAEGGGEYELCPAGNKNGAIVGLFDIGHQREEFNGESKMVRQLIVIYELKQRKKDGKPFVLGERYTWSMAKKAKFRKLAENVTGTSFADGARFDPRTLVGMPVSITIVHQPSRKDAAKTYHNIGSVSGLGEDTTPYTPTMSEMIWSVLSGTPFPTHLSADLPFIYGASIEDLAQGSREVRSRQAGGAKDEVEDKDEAKDDDDIPF